LIRALIDFALRNRLLVLGGTLVLFAWGIISFHNLPIEAYPDVADTYAQVITQWPGHAAEEVEQQITVPLEVNLNGVAHLTHLRSVSLAGLSVITMIYDDDITTFNARQEVLDRLQLVTLPPGVNPGLGPDYSPTGQIMFYTLTSTNPKYDAMELKTLNDWFVVNQLKSVPNIVDVNRFGGPTREYRVRIDPGTSGCQASLGCLRLGGEKVSAPALVLDLRIWISFHRVLEVETSGLYVASHLFDAEEGDLEVHGLIMKIGHVDYLFSQMKGEQKRTFSLQHAAHFR
jgi:hypothetical protein